MRTINSQTLIARIPKQAYQLEVHNLTSGIIDVPILCELGTQIEDEGLCVVEYDANFQSQILLTEQEINLQIDDACLFI